MKQKDTGNLVGCCGLYCGLCTLYQTKAKSRCPGCRVGEQHLWCSIWNCCVRKRKFVMCVECDEMFNCEIHLRRKVGDWIPAADNLHRIKKNGLEGWLKEQIQRQMWVERLLDNYNEGRSMKFYCTTCARMPIQLISEAWDEVKSKIRSEKIGEADMKAKAKIMKSSLQAIATKGNIILRS